MFLVVVAVASPTAFLFWQSGECNSLKEAVQKLWEEHVLPNATFDREPNFRKDVLWNEPVDMVFRTYMDGLNDVFRRFSGKFDYGTTALR